MYRGSQVALATRHGKERVIRRALQHGLGAALLHLSDLDTDQLGSFCGSVPRLVGPLEACRVKADLALELGGTGLAIASEGSFGPHPSLPLLAVGLECMVFLDADRQLVISEQLLVRRTNFNHLRITPWTFDSLAVPQPLQAWLMRVGFPSHALLVRPAGEAMARVQTDMRAHCNPTLMASIRQLSFRLTRRLGRLCPACGENQRSPRRDGQEQADPGDCPRCNP